MTTQAPELEHSLDARQDSTRANQLVAEAMAPTVASVPAVPAIDAPPDTSVELMAGLFDPLSGVSKTDAIVRELNGADEEALAAPALLRSPGKYFATLAQRGTVSIGGEPVKKEQLEALLIGDRELLLIAIRKATYGPELELETKCPECGAEDKDFKLDLSTVPIRQLEQPEDAIFGIKVELSGGRTAKVGLPTTADQDFVLAQTGKNVAELNSLMLSRCLKEVDGRPAIGLGVARQLSAGDRRKLLDTITDKTPGPRLGEVKRTCGACEQEFVLGLGLLDIFRF